MKKVELLAPAGNFDCLKAAINNGADAVYLGGKSFSARAFANNFDKDELIKAIRYAHLNDVKIYVTLNTLLSEFEFDNAIKMADFYYENHVDGLLIQDLGLYYVLKNKYPDFDLHCSTQMHVHNIEGIKNAKKLGFKRVVIARESNLELIKQACKQGIEVETFVHGALCVSYSGQCLMSSYSKNRSANKGMCAQCCRLKYQLLDKNNKTIKTDTDYLLSPKDMFLINDIDKLIEAGVSCFKIEGRMKSSSYVGYVTSMYRNAIDSYYENKSFKLSDEQLNNLKVLFNRDFTNDLLFNRNDIFNQKTPNHLGIEIGDVINNKNGLTYFKLTGKLNQFDGIRIEDFGCIVNMMYKDDLLVNSGDINDIIAIKTDSVSKGKVYKTLDHQLEEYISSIPDKKNALDLKVILKKDINAEVRLRHNDLEYTYISDIKPMQAINAPLTIDNIKKQFSKLNETIYYLNSIDIEVDDCFLSVKQLNDIRRNAIDNFNEYRLNSFKRTVIPCEIEFSDIEDEDHNEKMIKENEYIQADDKYYFNYVINEESKYSENNNVVISEFGGLLQNKNKIAYYTLNCSNSYAYEFLKRLGFKYIVLSSELNLDQVNKLIESYTSRTGKRINPYILKSGNKVLMYIKTNPFDKYVEDVNGFKLSDGNNTYSIRKINNITELLIDDLSQSEISNEIVKYLCINE